MYNIFTIYTSYAKDCKQLKSNKWHTFYFILSHINIIKISLHFKINSKKIYKSLLIFINKIKNYNANIIIILHQ